MTEEMRELIDGFTGILERLDSQYERAMEVKESTGRMQAESTAQRAKIDELRGQIEDLREQIKEKDGAYAELAEKGKECYARYRKYKGLHERDKEEIERLNQQIIAQRDHIKVLEDKLVVANRLSEEQKLRGIKTSKENAESDREKIAYLIDSWLRVRGSDKDNMRVDLGAIVQKSGCSKSTIYGFCKAILKGEVDGSRYVKYPHFTEWIRGGVRFKNTGN